jgi:serine O-acetyltransferase
MPGPFHTLREDVRTALARDPAASSVWEVLLYPHIHALIVHRVAHRLYLRRARTAARLLSLLARFVSGIDIHPGARIGRRLLIDHGAGVVVGETAVIGDDVTLYHQVTLGALGWWTDVRRPPGSKRHPTLEDGVVVGANASILGPVTVGRRSLVGAHSLVLDSVPPDSIVRAAPSTIVQRTPRDGAVTGQADTDEIATVHREGRMSR